MIVKTRHAIGLRLDANRTPVFPTFGQGCGVLRHREPTGAYEHLRYAPPHGLGEWVEHFWFESWDFSNAEGQPREVLPHPAVNLVLAAGRSRIYGVHLRRFSRELTGRQRIWGIKFLPGAFYPILGKPVRSIADSVIAAHDVFNDVLRMQSLVASESRPEYVVGEMGQWLHQQLPSPDANVAIVARAVRTIAQSREIVRAGQVASLCSWSERTTQRMFRLYVGANVRWVIKRYRIYEALESADSSGRVDWTTLAHRLGYFDQAHFCNDFKNIVGCTPSDYVSAK